MGPQSAMTNSENDLVLQIRECRVRTAESNTDVGGDGASVRYPTPCITAVWDAERILVNGYTLTDLSQNSLHRRANRLPAGSESSPNSNL